MKKIIFQPGTTVLFLMLIIPTLLFSQATENVLVQNDNFNRSNISTINVDSVNRTNSTGVLNNLNDAAAILPPSPQFIENSLTSNGSNSYKFIQPGKFGYKCDQHLAFGISGTIVVLPVSEINENDKSEVDLIFNPVNNIEFINNNTDHDFSQYKINSISGEKVMEGDFTNTIQFLDIKKGVYFINFISETSFVTKMIVVE